MIKEQKNYIPFDDAAIERLMNGINIEDESVKSQFKELLLREYQLSAGIVEKKLAFRKATIEKLKEIVNIERTVDNDKFQEWFS